MKQASLNSNDFIKSEMTPDGNRVTHGLPQWKKNGKDVITILMHERLK